MAINKEKGDVLTWRIHHLIIPQSLQTRKDDVLQLIKEALDARGWLYNRSRVSQVNVRFEN